MVGMRVSSGSRRNATYASVLGLSVFVLAGSAWSGDERTDAKVEYRGSLLVQLRVADLEKALVFYNKTLGFEVLLRSDELHWAELSIGVPNVKIGLGEGEDARGSGTTSLNIGVKDIDAARRTLEQRGVRFLRDTITIEGKVKLADFVDLDGNKIRLAQSLAGSS